MHILSKNANIIYIVPAVGGPRGWVRGLEEGWRETWAAERAYLQSRGVRMGSGGWEIVDI
jgi:hypothetical protein